MVTRDPGARKGRGSRLASTEGFRVSSSQSEGKSLTQMPMEAEGTLCC